MKGVRLVWMRASGVCASPPYPTVPARSVLSYLLLLLLPPHCGAPRVGPRGGTTRGASPASPTVLGWSGSSKGIKGGHLGGLKVPLWSLGGCY